MPIGWQKRGGTLPPAPFPKWEGEEAGSRRRFREGVLVRITRCFASLCMNPDCHPDRE